MPIRAASRRSAGRSQHPSRAALLARRDAWLREIDPDQLFHRLFDTLPGVYFFAKNQRGELMFLSRGNREIRHIQDEAAVIGLTDFDLNPIDAARAYVRDDSRILATGRPLLNHVEMWFDQFGMPDWFLVNKMPIRSRRGEIIGVMGISQNYESRWRMLLPSDAIARAVNHLRERHCEDITILDLAHVCGLSPRQLQRKFKATFGVGPQQYLIKTRLLAACRALRETQQGISEIAYACGFTDQSAFARHFRRHLGLTSTQFRQRHAG